jgi:hypothetical protein
VGAVSASLEVKPVSPAEAENDEMKNESKQINLQVRGAEPIPQRIDPAASTSQSYLWKRGESRLQYTIPGPCRRIPPLPLPPMSYDSWGYSDNKELTETSDSEDEAGAYKC